VTAFPPQDPKLIVKQLDSCAKEIRYHLAQELNLRRTPELEFFYDTEIEESTRIERIFYDLEQKKNKTEE
jgi:ribosome-binding factor A